MSTEMSNDDSTESFVALTKDTAVSHYTVIDKIGSGGMGDVYLAWDTELERTVALKFLHPNLCRDEDCRKRFKREAQAAARLDHANIVSVHEVGEFRNRPYIVMQHVEGHSLRHVIKQGKLSLEQTIDLATQICEGLREAHELGITHRDIKPSNILLDARGNPKLVDFGLATIAGTDKLTKTGSTLGTVGYMSPEQAEGKQVDQRSDLFSFGVVLYEMITGRRPFDRESDIATSKAIVTQTAEPLARSKAEVPDELQQIVDRALDKDIETRYQTASGMLADLKRLGSSDAGTGKRRFSLWFAAAAVIVLAAVGYFATNKYQLGTEVKKDGWSNSIAVLVFRNLSGDPEQDYFCEGMTEEIIGRLAKIKPLKVISTESMLRFQGDDFDLKDIAKQLKVANILGGSVQCEGDSIRVRAQLIRVEDETPIWSERFHREMNSLFAVQDDIARTIAEVLEMELTADEYDALRAHGTENIEAYQTYVKARYFWRKRTEKDILKALEYFERAIELDPNYALAYVGIADAWHVLPDYSNYSVTEVRPTAQEAVTKALELDGNLAEAHASMGLVHRRDLEFDKAENSFQKAMELNANYPWTYVWYGGLFNEYLVDYETGVEYYEKALELDPLSSVALNNMAGSKLNLGESGEAEELYRRTLEIEPDNASYLRNFSDFFRRTRQGDSALHYAERAVELEPNYWRPRVAYGNILGGFGRGEEALEQYELACQHSPNNWAAFDALANYYSWRQDYERAVEFLCRATELDPKAYHAWNKLAYCYAYIGEYKSALKAVNTAIEVAPWQPFYVDSRADIHVNFGAFDKAVADYRFALENLPNEYFYDTVQAKLARACVYAREYDLADSLYHLMFERAESGSSTARELTRARRQLTRSFCHQGKFRRAVGILQEFMTREGESLGDDWQVMGALYDMGTFNMYYLNDIDSAITLFSRRADMIWRLDSTAHQNVITRGRLAEAHALAGDEAAARDVLNDCWLNIDTTNASRVGTFKFYSAMAEYHLGNYDSALALIERLGYNPFTTKVAKGVMRLAAGRVEDAVTILEDAMSRYDDNRLTYPERSVMGHYHLGKAYEAAGRNTEAIEQYETFLDIWKNADEGLKPVEDAKVRLANLKRQI